MSKNKQTSNKAVPHKSTKAEERLKAENDALHQTFYAVHTPALYAPKGFLNSKFLRPSKSESNGFLAKQWNCTERHVSKVRSGRGTPTCTDSCTCPNAQKAAAAKSATAAS